MQIRITDATHRLFGELLGYRGVFNLWGKHLQPRVDIIARIEASREPAAAIELAIYAATAEAPLRERAAQAVHSLLAPASPDHLFHLEQQARHIIFHYAEDYPGTPQLKPGQLSTLSHVERGAEATLGAISFFTNGHVREKATRLLGAFNSGAELPFLLIRLNDWVPAVRAVAREGVRARLVPAYAAHFAACLSLINRLQQWRRDDHASVLNWISEYLRQPACSAAVTALFDSPDRKIRQQAYALLARPHQPGHADLLQRALRDRDPTLRLWAIRQARLHLDHASLLAIARQAVGDGYARVRSQAAYICAEASPEAAAPMLTALLMDPAPAVRGIARFYLARIEPIDYRALYRSRIASSLVRESSIAIAALGEAGAAADADLIAPYLRDTHLPRRAAALQALARLDGDRFIDEFLSALMDPSPAISRQGARALSPRVGQLDLDALWQELWRPHAPATLHRIAGLIFKATKWDLLYYAITLLSHEDPHLAAIARGQVQRWRDRYNYSALQPSAGQRQRLLEAVEKQGQLLGPGGAKAIRFYL